MMSNADSGSSGSNGIRQELQGLPPVSRRYDAFLPNGMRREYLNARARDILAPTHGGGT